ncbi:hypothetical protein SM124_23660 [Bacillus sp. 31A1R]|uniref:Uncharacterized protein n=1 Tax=Robertmurraya mangrovi TaxID=3098077 RepID=A0ABU5J5F4_9BACI|nr:hypothetical protein [Bacillus sp. 31A1R]MDZ5474642.1 hypothetical protein [Bacillus sp. 31A1R]
MIFIGLAISLILLIAGGIGLGSAVETQEFIISSVLLGSGALLLLLVLVSYWNRERKKKRKSDSCCDNFYFDCPSTTPDCSSKGSSKSGWTDCDCTPDCTN